MVVGEDGGPCPCRSPLRPSTTVERMSFPGRGEVLLGTRAGHGAGPAWPCRQHHAGVQDAAGSPSPPDPPCMWPGQRWQIQWNLSWFWGGREAAGLGLGMPALARALSVSSSEGSSILYRFSCSLRLYLHMIIYQRKAPQPQRRFSAPM